MRHTEDVSEACRDVSEAHLDVSEAHRDVSEAHRGPKEARRDATWTGPTRELSWLLSLLAVVRDGTGGGRRLHSL